MSPSLTEVRAWDTAHLTDAAKQWTASATTWEHTFTQVTQRVGTPGGKPWEGTAAESAWRRVHSDRTLVLGFVDQLHSAAAAATKGAGEIQAAKAAVLRAVDDAEKDGFTVGEDFAVSSTESGSWDYLSAREAKAVVHSHNIQAKVGELLAAESRVATDVQTKASGLGAIKFAESGEPGLPAPAAEAPVPPQAGQPVPVGATYVGDENFGHWETLPPPPPYVGKPPPLTTEYRPFGDDTPLKVGPTTGMYTPGKTWVTDDQAPAVQAQEGYRFRIAGNEATTFTRMVNENGQWRQQRWVGNVYEYQRNTQMTLGGDVGLRMHDGSGTGDLGGLGPFPIIDRSWEPISLSQISRLSANNADVTYYLPDGCGGAVNFVGGTVPRDPSLPAPIPVMTRPR